MTAARLQGEEKKELGRWLGAGEKETEDLCLLLDQVSGPAAYGDATLLITGATGFLGRLLVKAFLLARRMEGSGCRLLAQVRNPQKARQVFGPLLQEEGLELVVGDIREPLSLPGPVDYIFHTASVTASKQMSTQPVETLHTAYAGTRNILELAKEKKAKGVVYLSSMEVYGQPDPEKVWITEQDLGYLNLQDPRSSYPLGKRVAEGLCTAYGREYGVPVRIARLAQTFGAGLPREDTRVYAQFAKSVLEGRDIVLHTEGRSQGNYCYTRDAVNALLLLGLEGVPGEAYNVVNPASHMEIRQMAQLVAEEVAEGRIRVVYDLPEDPKAYGYAPSVRMRLSGDKLMALGWSPQVGLLEAYRRMLADMGWDR